MKTETDPDDDCWIEPVLIAVSDFMIRAGVCFIALSLVISVLLVIRHCDHQPAPAFRNAPPTLRAMPEGAASTIRNPQFEIRNSR